MWLDPPADPPQPPPKVLRQRSVVLTAISGGEVVGACYAMLGLTHLVVLLVAAASGSGAGTVLVECVCPKCFENIRI